MFMLNKLFESESESESTISLFPGRMQAYYRSHRTGFNSAL